MTPFGAEVDPEVYCRNAMSSGMGWRPRCERASDEAGRFGFVDREKFDGRPGATGIREARTSSPRSPAISPRGARARRGVQSATMPALASRALFRRGSIIGTASPRPARSRKTRP